MRFLFTCLSEHSAGSPVCAEWPSAKEVFNCPMTNCVFTFVEGRNVLLWNDFRVPEVERMIYVVFTFKALKSFNPYHGTETERRREKEILRFNPYFTNPCKSN